MAPVFGVISGACSTGRLGTVTTMVTGHVITVSLLLGSWTYRGLQEKEAQKMVMSVPRGFKKGHLRTTIEFRIYVTRYCNCIVYIHLFLHIEEQCHAC